MIWDNKVEGPLTVEQDRKELLVGLVLWLVTGVLVVWWLFK